MPDNISNRNLTLRSLNWTTFSTLNVSLDHYCRRADLFFFPSAFVVLCKEVPGGEELLGLGVLHLALLRHELIALHALDKLGGAIINLD